jgi:transcriptional regulator with XRE-family HTH domain
MNDLPGGTALRTPTFSPARLRAARVRKGLTQEQAAGQIGRVLSTYVRYELGYLEPSIDALGALCVALDVPVGALFDDPRNE